MKLLIKKGKSQKCIHNKEVLENELLIKKGSPKSVYKTRTSLKNEIVD